MEGPRPLGLLLQYVLPDLQDLEEPSLLPLQAAVGRREHMAALGIAPKHFAPRLRAPRCG